MGTKVAINGFGRIGRMVFRKLMLEGRHDVVAINASYPAETLAHLIKHDTVHGPFELTVRAHGDTLVVDGKQIRLIAERDPERLPWKELDVEIVVEATGKFNSDVGARKHLMAGAQKVILTAPGKGDLRTIVMGVNDREYMPEQDHIISNASCTTNCLAPVVKVLDSTFGIETGLVTTVHAYTNDQNNIDNPHKDLRRARACGSSIIPTSTGAAKAIGLVLPELQGKLNGMALRVPTPNVSLVDLVVELRRDVTAAEVNDAFERAAYGEMTGILGVSNEPLVSIDFNGDERSSIIDADSTMVLGGNHVKVLAWYDNEWGYSCRVVDLLDMVASYLQIGQQETHA
ncbi:MULTISPECIES: glyceraldehyde-3-phosphate dehydrogenase [unclassified Exiguobacterium]|uniref:glyceraldehyde-3-phosphate dehydrogenase n=1 Tax=unclassified Exiguobacterium TaxID=2644629 RepID=UPI0010400820|nr:MULTISPECIES: glyceraldehyde-3-phosphate dehydrogenase [unclassified Exiguobacterium]TCI39512.1 glyceraldehyde-3-phosphate dehydrogenase [Exiguobacterium sp. SH4S7]TCI47794.1 glyceraldehyde-3-phosphate dehydrogenase [Exiguobacterium sp. SH5S32]TCI54677.1 glyceraldehyde-3-phosphate dehydrogenase [Exiguobacterium sp. SH1S4]TCI61528.1 glyceraldehyde-3-phosphate dehydrogenase [Exiguobacterium sp. SH0S2]TCI74474.1 glyceraldehyde-3-phosphate dehydrogenase [Exiguobacterium sp. SH1S1]